MRDLPKPPAYSGKRWEQLPTRQKMWWTEMSAHLENERRNLKELLKNEELK